MQEAAIGEPVELVGSDSDTPLSLRVSRRKLAQPSKKATRKKGPILDLSSSSEDSDTPLSPRSSGRKPAPPSKKAKKWGVVDVVAAAQKALGRVLDGPAKAPPVAHEVGIYDSKPTPTFLDGS